MQHMKYLRTSDIAKSVGIHPNTVRLYEKWGLLSAADRSPAGYRLFTGAHLFQVKLIRLAMKCTFFGREIKRTTYGIIKSSAAAHYSEALSLAADLEKIIDLELRQAEAAEEFLEQWAQERKRAEESQPADGSKSTYRSEPADGSEPADKNGPTDVSESTDGSEPTYGSEPAEVQHRTAPVSARTAAHMLNITTDMLRDWERNGLIKIPRNPDNGYRLYGPYEINKLRVIRALRRSKYSNMSILRAINKLESGSTEGLREALDSPELDEDRGYLCFTDTLLTALKTAKSAVGEIVELLKNQI